MAAVPSAYPLRPADERALPFKRSLVTSTASPDAAAPHLPKALLLAIIVAAQIAGSAQWFAGNAVTAELIARWELPQSFLAQVTLSVQLGFIIGTLIFAALSISDRLPSRLVFFVSCLLAGGGTLALPLLDRQPTMFLLLRFVTGFFIAGIYPVGMKLAASWFDKGLSVAMSLLVGALMVGTALPHLLRGFLADTPWQLVLVVVGLVSFAGGVLLLATVPLGPYAKRGAHFAPKAVIAAFKVPDFRRASFGYFGHMWELYALWAYFPVLIAAYLANKGQVSPSTVATWSFLAIAAGAPTGVIGGWIAQKVGSAWVARSALAASGACCLAAPLMLLMPGWLFFTFLLIWGGACAADSPQLSTINAKSAPPAYLGSALTMVNSLGFSITLISITMTGVLVTLIPAHWAMLALAPGPLLGAWSLRSSKV